MREATARERRGGGEETTFLISENSSAITIKRKGTFRRGTFNYARRYVFAQIVVSFIYFNEVFI